MIRILSVLLGGTFLLLTSCGEGWSEERKQQVKDRCLGEVYDCECYLQKTMEVFPDPEEFNNQTPNDQEKYNAALEECEKEVVVSEEEEIESF